MPRWLPRVLKRVRGMASASEIRETTGEWMYVFKPVVGGQNIYVKPLLRQDCLVVSFHEDEGGGHEEDE